MKNLYLYPLILPIIFVTACGASSGLQVASTSSNNTLSIEVQLIVGTIRLEGTEQAVTAEQSKELLPMWQVYRELTNSSTAAQEEIDGLVEQIQETMTSDQVNAITAMELTQSDIFSLIQEQDISIEQPQRNSSGSSTQSNTNFAPPDGGMAGGPADIGMAEGAPPGGGLGDMGGAVPSVSMDQTQNAGASSSPGGTAGILTDLIDALIQYLEQVAGF